MQSILYTDTDWSGEMQIVLGRSCHPLSISFTSREIQSLRVAPGDKCTTYFDSECKSTNQHYTTSIHDTRVPFKSESVRCVEDDGKAEL